MLKVTVIEFLLRAIPESLIYMVAMYALAGLKVDKKKCLISTLILAVSMVVIRTLPISYGIHTILIIMVSIGLAVIMNKLNIISVIRASIICIVIQFLAEGINVMLIDKVFGLNIEEIFSNPINKVIYGIPSLVIWAAIIPVCYYLIIKKKRIKNA